MSKPKKTWILVRGREYQPGRSICLGQMLTKPFEPSIPLLPDGPLPVPDSEIERTYQTSVDITSSSSLGGSFKIWADVNLLPIQTELGGRSQRSQSEIWHFDKLESEIMVPRLSAVQTAMKSEEVVAQINRFKFDFRKRLYMITGVRIARGASLQQESSISTGGDAKFGVDLTMLTGAPVTVGPAIDGSIEHSSGLSFKGSSDFVYAYRVCEIHYGKDVYVKPYNKGDTQGAEDSENMEEDEDEELRERQNRILVEKISPTDYAGSGELHKVFKLASTVGDQQDEFILVDSDKH